MIYFIIGASGTGKSTLFRKLCEIYKDYPFPIFPLSQITTRPIRDGEDGEEDLSEYRFITPRVFFREAELYSAKAAFYNTALATPNVFYGLPDAVVHCANLANEKFFMTASPALLEDYLIRHARTELYNVHIINLIADFEYLEERLIARGDDAREVHRRIEHDIEDVTRLLALICELKDNNNGGFERHTTYPRRYEINVGPPYKFDQVVRRARVIIED